MSRVLLIATAVATALTVATIAITSLLDVTTGRAHLWADLTRSAAVVVWLLVGMVRCTDRAVTAGKGEWREVGTRVDRMEKNIDGRLSTMQTRLNTVEDVIEDLDHERIQANAIVISIFKNRKSV